MAPKRTTLFRSSSKNVTVSPTSWANLSDFSSLRVILATKTSDVIGTYILSRPAAHLLSPALAMLGFNAPQNPGSPRFHQPQLPHADDRGPLASADHAAGGERQRKIHPPPFPLL